MCSRPSTRAVAIVVAAFALIGGFAVPAAGAPLSDGDPSLGSGSDDADASLTDAIGNETSLDDTETDDGADSGDTTDADGSGDNTSDADGTETELGDDLEATTDRLEDATNETAEGLEDATNETADTLENGTDDVTEPLENATNETTAALETAGEQVEKAASTAGDASVRETDTRVGVTLGVTGAENATLHASAGLGSGESGTGATDRGSAAASSRQASNSAAATGESESHSQSDAVPPTAPSNGDTATDAVLVGLMGTITASSAAAAGASSAGAGAGASAGAGTGAGLGGTASNLVTNWLHPTRSRWLRRLCSLAPVELLSVLGYSRYDDSDPLENERRESIYELIRTEPGCYLSEVSDRQDVSLSTVRHHVRILEEEGLIAAVTIDGKRRYFTVEDEADAALHAALAESAKRAVLETLSALGPVTNGRLADELERDPSTVSHHLSALEDDGLVVRKRDGRAVVNALAADAEAAIRGETEGLEEADEPRPSVSSPADD